MTAGPGRRSLSTGALARVEGEGAMRIEIEDGQLVDVQLEVYEPPRFFEGLLRGRHFTEPPDITARICGICPVAYQMSACAAIEDALGVVIDGPLHELRRLLYCGEWIESHALHIMFLHAPDFCGFDSALDMIPTHREAVERGMEIKKIGNEILQTLGGRSVHPVNVKVGGFYRVPERSELAPLGERLRRGRDLAVELVDWVAAFDRVDQRFDGHLMAADDPTGYPLFGPLVTSTTDLGIEADTFLSAVEEHQVEHSTALHARLGGQSPYLVGPMARYGLAADRLRPVAADAARDAGLASAWRNPFASIVVRAVEVLHAFDTAIEIVDLYRRPAQPAVAVEARAGVGHGLTEAPRGLLYHRYELDAEGRITGAVIVPPTAQNQTAIEADLWAFVEQNLDLDDETLRRRAEVTIRNHDPCISCATHFLDLTVVRR